MGNIKRHVIIFVFYSILITSLYLCFNGYRNEKYDNMNVDKIKLYNWWNTDEKSQMDTIYFFKDLIGDDALQKYNEINIYSVFGGQKIDESPDILRIQYSGESYYSDPGNYDINIIPDSNYDPSNPGKTVIIPHGFFHILMSKLNMDYFTNTRTLTGPKKKFCLFSVSNGSSYIRNIFFDALSKYKRIDSCGGFMNNMLGDERCPTDPDKYFEHISDYKFMICFENKPQKNYLTEKLFNAYYGGAIPIYWGCSNVNDYINMNSILYLKTDYTDYELKNLIREIIRLDNDDEEYNKRYSYELFRNGIIPDEFDIDKIKEKVSALIPNKENVNVDIHITEAAV